MEENSTPRPRGRPRIALDTCKRRSVAAWLTPDEHAWVLGRAAERGVSVSQLARELLLSGYVAPPEENT